MVSNQGPMKNCPKCGEPEGMINCPKCREEDIALEVNNLLDWRIWAPIEYPKE